ncbi:nucleoside phosphorylase domain-containing protein [Xylariales sp. PMI_506]|nr:nucleoside phosphorylase domain-containing protein [Xylariales sp. PMI_506]
MLCSVCGSNHGRSTGVLCNPPDAKRYYLGSFLLPHILQLSHKDYNVGWVCALHTELAAARAVLEEEHAGLPKKSNDSNTYTLGRIGHHNIVIACLPMGAYGTNNAATVASNMNRSFPGISVRLVVGIGGGSPCLADVRLGDVVVSSQVVQYDLGKTISGGHFQATLVSQKPPHATMTAVAKLRADHESRPNAIPTILSDMLKRHPHMWKYGFVDNRLDELFQSTYDHDIRMENCDHCDRTKLVHRPSRSNRGPQVHYGGITSGNQVMKHAETRDRLSKQLNIICFEMEAAGLMNEYPYLIIRGICDYSDSHKSKQWQDGTLLILH